MKNILVLVMLLSVSFLIFHLGVMSDVHATCAIVNGTQVCAASPPVLTSIKPDRLNYVNLDRPVITIIGVPYSKAYLEIADHFGNIVFSHNVEIPQGGIGNYTLDILSYMPGIYSATASTIANKMTATFAIGLEPSGNRMILEMTKNIYIRGNYVAINGAGNSNSLIQLSLIDPAGNIVVSAKVYSDKTGHFSSSDLYIPNTTVSGNWKIDASSGLSHVTVEFKVIQQVTNTIDPPLKQLKSGIIEYNVVCADNMYLTLSPIKNRIACVKIDTAQKLAERGWKSFILQTPDKEALVLKQCRDSAPLIDYITQDNKTDNSVNPDELYSTTFWWVPLNSVVNVCVKYYSFQDNVSVPLHIREPNSYNYTKFIINASQDTISKGTTIVSYEFNTGNQKGRYLMGFDCGEIPIAIGSNASELNRTDFPLVQKYNCPAWGSYNHTIVGTSGIYEKHFK